MKFLASIEDILTKIDRVLLTDFWVKYHNQKIRFHDSKYSFPDSKISLIHVPKTAGTSTAAILSKLDKDLFLNLDKHVPISEYCPPTRYRYITTLRDPVDRVWSYYHMILRSPDWYPYKAIATKGLKFFLGRCWEARNMYCRYYFGQPYVEPNINTISTALKNLMQFDAVFLFDRLYDDLLYFAKSRFNCSALEIPHHRQADYPRPSADQILAIQEFNWYDIALYNAYLKLAETKEKP